MCSSLPIVLSMLLIGAISSTTADISNQPNSQTLQGPPGTKLVHTFVMKGATVSFYQKTTVVTTQSTTTRARERRQVSNDQDPSLLDIPSPNNASMNTSYDNTTNFNNNTRFDNTTTDSNGTSIVQSMSNLTTVDLTPAEPTSWDCYSGSFQQPLSADCDVVIAAQMYNSTGSLTAAPGTYVYVTHGTCVTAFQNPEPSEYSLQYNWAELGSMAQRIKTGCMAPEMNNIGGAALFDAYLDFSFNDVIVSLQRYAEPSSALPPSNVTNNQN